MEGKIARLMIVFFLLIATLNSFSQLNVQQMTSFNLGETFNNARPKIKKLFLKNPSVTKADFLGAYRIEYEDSPFDYYGNAKYCFQFIKDTLVSIKVEFTFMASEILNFKRLYTALIHDFAKDKSKKFIGEISKLNSAEIFPYVEAECKVTADKNDKNYKPIKTKYFGQNYWDIYKNSYYDDKFLVMSVDLSETHNLNFEAGKKSTYDGGAVSVLIEMTSDRFVELNSEESKLTYISYKTIEDASDQIKLKNLNGTYLIPVKLNNTISIDFILDLGASDVSISPDIFLVLYRAGTIEESDFIGSQTYQFADGSTAKSSVFNIKSIQIGDKEIKNVRASINNSLSAPLLLGQSALKKLNSYRIDNYQKLLIIE